MKRVYVGACVYYWTYPALRARLARYIDSDALLVAASATTLDHVGEYPSLKVSNELFEFSSYKALAAHFLESDRRVAILLNDTIFRFFRWLFIREIERLGYLLEANVPVIVGNLERGLPGIHNEKPPLMAKFIRSHVFAVNRAGAELLIETISQCEERIRTGAAPVASARIAEEIRSFSAKFFGDDARAQSRKEITIGVEQCLTRSFYERGIVVPIASTGSGRIRSWIVGMSELVGRWANSLVHPAAALKRDTT